MRSAWLGMVVMGASLVRLVWTPSWVFAAGLLVGAVLWFAAESLARFVELEKSKAVTDAHREAQKALDVKFDSIKQQLSRVESLHALRPR